MGDAVTFAILFRVPDREVPWAGFPGEAGAGARLSGNSFSAHHLHTGASLFFSPSREPNTSASRVALVDGVIGTQVCQVWSAWGPEARGRPPSSQLQGLKST